MNTTITAARSVLKAAAEALQYLHPQGEALEDAMWGLEGALLELENRQPPEEVADWFGLEDTAERDRLHEAVATATSKVEALL